MEKGKVVFKHARHNYIQALFGDLNEDASLEAVTATEVRVDKLMADIREKHKEASERNENISESIIIEMCYNEAKSIQELMVFISEASGMYSKYNNHPIYNIMSSLNGGGNH